MTTNHLKIGVKTVPETSCWCVENILQTVESVHLNALTDTVSVHFYLSLFCNLIKS